MLTYMRILSSTSVRNVHYLYCIYVACFGDNLVLRWFCSLGLLKNLSQNNKILLYWIIKIVLSTLMMKTGLLLMEHFNWSDSFPGSCANGPKPNPNMPGFPGPSDHSVVIAGPQPDLHESDEQAPPARRQEPPQPGEGAWYKNKTIYHFFVERV